MGTYEGNVERFSGFAGDYDRYRFSPPEILHEVLCRYAAVERPGLVVDLGCGTGLSTRFWADRADRVVGVEPVGDMLAQAAKKTAATNVEYLEGYGHKTGLPAGAADIVTCSQSFHWMEPTSTLTEVSRILRPGGVFAAYDYDSSVTGIAELDRQAVETSDRVYRIERERGLKREVRFFAKEGHAENVERSGHFLHMQEMFLHKIDWTSAEHLVRGFETLGALQTLRKMGLTDDELGVTALRVAAEKLLGDETIPMYVSYIVCLGVVGT